MSKMKKKAFMCLGIDTSENAEKIAVECQVLLAESERDARDLFLLKNHHDLDAISEHMEILVSPFCSG